MVALLGVRCFVCLVVFSTVCLWFANLWSYLCLIVCVLELLTLIWCWVGTWVTWVVKFALWFW